ncbi:unnamed protein product [Aureobasidium mustum]|uniref:Uncharacterized protein n=1 Tax=Aureobasidium mustum TaxID=2773714 RepID=A0A9N8JFM1_9PEZI|nr:unnamed protein product [Aureobasidium mustum]
MTARSTSAPSVIEIKSGDDKRPKRPTLQTPLSASYPSEVKSPFPGTPSFIKREENIKTPVTPPVAYLDFLKSMPTGLASPLTTGTSSKFHFQDKVPSEAIEEVDEKSPDATPEAVQPTLSRTNSTSSESSTTSVISSSTESVHSVSSTVSETKETKRKAKPRSPRVIIPPSPFAKPRSAKLPRGIQVPPSPMSPANLRSPMSARTHYEPHSASALSGAPWSATYSPTEAESSTTSKMSVRQVVTRTVTYSRTPLDPAPKGKRRKIEE